MCSLKHSASTNLESAKEAEQSGDAFRSGSRNPVWEFVRVAHSLVQELTLINIAGCDYKTMTQIPQKNLSRHRGVSLKIRQILVK